MANYSIDVLLQFPAMAAPLRVTVPIRELFFLDLQCDRSIAADGTIIYRLPRAIDGILTMQEISTRTQTLVLN